MYMIKKDDVNICVCNYKREIVNCEDQASFLKLQSRVSNKGPILFLE